MEIIYEIIVWFDCVLKLPCRKLAKSDGSTDFFSHHATILLASQTLKSHKIEHIGHCVQLFHENNILEWRDESCENSYGTRKSWGLNVSWGTQLICLEMTWNLKKWQYLVCLRDCVVPWLRYFVNLLCDVLSDVSNLIEQKRAKITQAVPLDVLHLN